MNNAGNQVRTRQDRVARMQLPPGETEKFFATIRRPDVLSRIGLCLIVALTLWAMTRGWNEPLRYRTRQVPKRDMVARADFSVADAAETEKARNKARRTIECVYTNEGDALKQLVFALGNKIGQITAAESIDDLAKSDVLGEFFVALAPNAEGAPQDLTSQKSDLYNKLVEYFAETDFKASPLKIALDDFVELKRNGLLESLSHEIEQGDQDKITVKLEGDESATIPNVPVTQVLLSESKEELLEKLESIDGLDIDLAKAIHIWLARQLTPTLTFDKESTASVAEAAAAAVETRYVEYKAGRDHLAVADKPIGSNEFDLLRRENIAANNAATWLARVARGSSSFGMYIALYVLGGLYIIRRRPDLIRDFRKFCMMQGLILSAFTLYFLASGDNYQAELIPMVMFAMTATIIYQQDVALLLCAALSLVTALAFGHGMNEFVVLAATLSTTVLLLKHVRTRTRLINVGFAAGLVAILTTLGVGVVTGRPLGTQLYVSASWCGFMALVAGLLQTGIMPGIENIFDVQTEQRLLQLADVSHPLLQELVRRAPGTYNHSISVASIAEAAADSIGANGLLLRVGAYFHDIGKMLKPQYFIENQAADGNRHELLMPAMSTLIIIAHVKDGADLARRTDLPRRYKLPQAIIDLILQHHGTTLVEYFYRRANEQSAENPDSGDVDEGSYRYPGPKPQTREAAVLMLADSVESASRTLTEPAPARIESMVDDIAMKKLLDGQFDECGLTLQELRTVQDSLTKSLSAMFHGRVKYPDQATA